MAERDSDAPIAGDGQSTIALTRRDGRREVAVNSLAITTDEPAGITIGNLAGSSRETIAARTDAARRLIVLLLTAMQRQSRANQIHPAPKPKAARKAPVYEPPVRCPACLGDDPHCETCYGTGQTPASVAAKWADRHDEGG